LTKYHHVLPNYFRESVQITVEPSLRQLICHQLRCEASECDRVVWFPWLCSSHAPSALSHALDCLNSSVTSSVPRLVAQAAVVSPMQCHSAGCWRSTKTVVDTCETHRRYQQSTFSERRSNFRIRLSTFHSMVPGTCSDSMLCRFLPM